VCVTLPECDIHLHSLHLNSKVNNTLIRSVGKIFTDQGRPRNIPVAEPLL